MCFILSLRLYSCFITSGPGLCRLSYIVYLKFWGETTWGNEKRKGMGANRLGLKTEAIQLEGKRLSGGGGVLGAKLFIYQSTPI